MEGNTVITRWREREASEVEQSVERREQTPHTTASNIASSPETEGARAPPPPIMDGSPPPRREALDPSNEGSAEPSRQSREARTEHRRSSWRQRQRPPPPGSMSRRAAYPSPPTLVGPHQSIWGPPPRRDAHDPSNEASAEPSRESREAPTEHRRSRRSRRRELLRRGQPSQGSVDEGAADPSPASHEWSFPFLKFQDPTTGPRLLGSGTSHPRIGAHVRQSLIYSDRPRRSRTRRPALAEERTHEESSSELGKAVIDLPTIETLSLSDPPLLTPPTEADEETDDDCAGLPTAGQTALFFNRPKGLSRSMVLPRADSFFITVSNDEEERPKPYSDEDPEELRRRIKEYLDKCPCIDLSVASDRIEAIEDVNFDSHAAELGAEPPSVLPEQTSVAAERHEASTAWMNEEVMLCFKKLIEISPDLAELEDYHLHELCHQCFNVESYDKVYHHYNFMVRMKFPNSADWTVQLYFAEVKEIFRTKHYLCYPLDPHENGQCYACKSQGVEDLRHPAIDLFETGSFDASAYNLWYTADE